MDDRKYQTHAELAKKMQKLTLEFVENKNKALGKVSDFGWAMFYHWQHQLDCLELVCKTISTDPEFLAACGFPTAQTTHQNPAHYSNLNITKGK